jgi:ribosome-binding protein aMBF1 (putative translation factor)
LPPSLGDRRRAVQRFHLLPTTRNQRAIHVTFGPKQHPENRSNPLQMQDLTLCDLIKAKRADKNFTPGHVAAKMGIAHAVVRSWEAGESQPDSHQLNDLAAILGFDAKDFEAHICSIKIMPFPALESQLSR